MASFSSSLASALAPGGHNEFRERLKLFYRQVDPPKLLNIDQIVLKHHNRQEALFNFLAKKYKVNLKELLSEDDDRPSEPRPIAMSKTQGTDHYDGSNAAQIKNWSHHSPPFSAAPIIPDDGMRLDFCGQHFDPMYAISRPDKAKLHLPAPKVRPLDNISKCRVLLPESDPSYLDVKLVRTARSAVAGAAAEALRAKRKKEWEDLAKTDSRMLRGLPDRLAARFRKKERVLKEDRNGIRRSRHMESSSPSGSCKETERNIKSTNVNPLNLLESCYRERRRIRVFIRGDVGGTKGTVVGYLKVFDKHMNMVLADADEEVDVCVGWDWVARRADAAAALANGKKLSAKAKRRLKKIPVMQRQRRHLHQSFIRGSNVILVQALDN